MTMAGVAAWSQTAADNATSDNNVNWAEGQAPSSINDSARSMMASTAKWRDDISGAIVTGGTSTAYTVSSNQVFDTLTRMSGNLIAFTPHTTNGGTCTLNVDSLGPKPLRSAPSVELPAGMIIQGTPYLALYNNSDGAFYLHGVFSSPIPLASSMEYWATTAPNSSFAFPYGQAISRSTYSVLFSLVGTTYGSGDGSTTFNLPDCRGRVIGCPDNMGGADAGRLTGSAISGSRNALGGAGGESLHTLTAAEIPAISSTGTGSNNISVNFGGAVPVANTAAFTNFQTVSSGSAVNLPGVPIGGSNSWIGSITSASAVNNIGVNSSSTNTGGGVHNNVQPMILCNRIMRII